MGINTTCTPMKQHNSKKVMFIFSLHTHILSERVYVIVVKFIGGDYVHVVKFIWGGDYVHFANFKGDYVHLYKNEQGGGVVRGILPYTLLSKQYQSTVDT